MNKPRWWGLKPNEYKIGRLYHTTWQSKPGMRFRLKEINGDFVVLGTDKSPKTFSSKLSDLRNIIKNQDK